MKRFFTFCCAILGMGATMYGASANLSDYLNQDGNDGGSSFTITTNSVGTLTFSGSYTDAEASGQSDGSYSVSFDIAAVADDEGSDTYTVTMSNFVISGSLSSAFSGDGDVTASATGITSIEVSAGEYDSEGLLSSYLPITIEGQGLGTRTVDISEYLKLLDLLGGQLFSSFAQYVTVTMTCTSNATLAIKVGEEEFVSCGFAVDDDGISFSADGLENIFDTLTVEGEIVTVEANNEDVTAAVVESEAETVPVSIDFVTLKSTMGARLGDDTDWTEDDSGLEVLQSDLDNSNNGWITILTDAEGNEMAEQCRYREQGTNPVKPFLLVKGSEDYYGDALAVTFIGTGTITVSIASTGGDNTSTFGLRKNGTTEYIAATSSDGLTADTQTNEYIVTGTTVIDVTYDIVEPGMYIICTNPNNDATRGTRVYDIVMTDNYDADAEPVEEVYDGAVSDSGTPDVIIASIDLLPNFTNDWASAATYDVTTNTVTWLAPGGYDGNGAWFGSVLYGGTPSDFSEYDGILVTFTIEQDDYFQLTIEYDNGTTSSNTGLNCVAGENTLYLAFDPDGITEVTQCYVLCGTIEQTVIVTYAAVVKYGMPSAISSVSSDTEATEVARYNLMGQKLSGAEKGINIIVYSDGSAKKVLVK